MSKHGRVGKFTAFRPMGMGLAMGLAMAGPGAAQTTQSFDEFQAKVNEGAARIAQYQQVLQNPDARIQYEAVRLLLKSGDPALVRIAKEHALFSTNPVLRNSAILAIFEAGGNLRIEVTAIDESSAALMSWIEKAGGSHNGKVGSYVFPLGAKSGDCWESTYRHNNYCQLRVSGTTVQFAGGYLEDKAQASLTLGPDGVLRGVIFSDSGKASATIDLKE